MKRSEILKRIKEIKAKIDEAKKGGMYSQKGLDALKAELKKTFMDEFQTAHSTKLQEAEKAVQEARNKYGKGNISPEEKDLLKLKIEAMTDNMLFNMRAKKQVGMSDFEAYTIAAELRKRGKRVEADEFMERFENYDKQVDEMAAVAIANKAKSQLEYEKHVIEEALGKSDIDIEALEIRLGGEE